MKTLLASSLAATILVVASHAGAQSPPQRAEQPSADRAHQGGAPKTRESGRRDAPKRYKAIRYAPPRRYQARQWRKGETLPAGYRGNAYVVDHRRYGLGAPPRGQHYVRVGDDVVQTAIATGDVTSVVVGLFQ